MPMTDAGWIVDPFVTWRDGVRSDVEGRLGVAVDWDGTPESAIVDAVADDVWTLDQGGQSIVDMLSPLTAADAQLDIIGEAEGIPRRAARPSRYEVEVVLTSGASGVVVPVGTTFRYTGVNGSTLWDVIEAETVDNGDPVIVQAQTAGAVFLPPGASLTVVSPVSGLEGATRSAADAVQLGRDRESAAAYRIRLQRLAGTEGGTEPGWYRAILAVDFVTDVSITYTAPATAVVRVVPGSLTTAQGETLAQAIYNGAPAGIAYDGALSSPQTADATKPDGYPETITWYEGVEESVDAAVVVTLESGYTLGDGGALDVEPDLEDAYAALFAGVGIGGSLRWSDYYCAMAEVEGVARVSTTDTETWLDSSGSQVDVTPSASTNLLTAGTLTAST